MVTLEKKLLNILLELKDEEFKLFTWFLKKGDNQKGFSGIPVAKLAKADREDTVDLMVHNYQTAGALLMTVKVLKYINRNDLVQHLQNYNPETQAHEHLSYVPPPLLRYLLSFLFSPYIFLLILSILSGINLLHLWPSWNKPTSSSVGAVSQDVRQRYFGTLKEEYERNRAELKIVQQFAVDVTLDLDTAHPNLKISADRKQVRHSDVKKDLPDLPQRFNKTVIVLGKESYTGKFYFEVQVKKKTKWDLGVAEEWINRKGDISVRPENGYWTIWLRNVNEYKAHDGSDSPLYPRSRPEKVGVFVDYDEGLVSFYDVDTAALLHSYNGCYFTERLYPLFSPCTNNGGRNSAPLIITPVDHTD